ncbi:glycoside hydrolase family 3 C-terminal domain-containing protein [Pelomonas sp. P7]|uniref:Glycoside hydrolase family 3 C-terminal domain-containing protein n=1 Tax=Pelomonas caseinilytica TaxID=2906763 RepID=A0ABS8XD34_9BURK|nr:glycoside hydrolase family 3 N-terminal domain-containing protein [Pelomonas sp. P7]MCE4537292.1 glycoside hydrolase family 3 C-terminal domain-containing protein [Pelomonas sp. P7]
MTLRPLFRTLLPILLSFTAGMARAETADIERRLDALMAQMTLEEKVGQLNILSGETLATGPVTFKGDHATEIRAGRIGAMLNVVGVNSTRQYQALARQSRLKIPLLFGQDVIHGYATTFPIPLAEAASWDLPAIERSARVAATEAASAGIHWTFAPMVDIARDPRWGRVMEGAGEDPYLGSRIAAARVRGFQGRGLGELDAVMACVKHFAAYGAAVGGRDYNSVDMSERQLFETYLPPFKAAAEAGAATFMNSFNDLNGVPATGNRHLQRDILKGQWGFTGFVVSDWGSMGEMVTHGYVKDDKAAAEASILAGSDMDMESQVYGKHLAELVKEGRVPMATLDDAVRRVLRKKFELGLFDDADRFADAARERSTVGRPEFRQAAREMAAKSIVLLKSDGRTLPLSPRLKTIAFIGPMVKPARGNRGGWSVSVPGHDADRETVSQWQGLAERAKANGTRLLYAKGADMMGSDRSGFAEAVRVARQADVVVVSVGESWDWSAEAKSRSDIGLPGVQEDLVKALHATGKPLVVLLSAGRPMVFDWIADHVPNVAYTWWLGSEAGHAIADVLYGDHNPSARLPISFPRSVGQIPVYYNHFNTGRPATDGKQEEFKSGYIDSPNAPRFAFGHGLSYTSFAYAGLRLSTTRLGARDTLTVSLDVRNTGERAGDEVVQLYLRDRVASVVRPVKELKDFQRVHLAPGEVRTVSFQVDRDKLSFFNDKLQWVAEPGEFDLMVGAASDDIRLSARFELLE